MVGKRMGTSALALGAALSTLVASPEARACGGFFCSSANPVNQAAERIIFAKNDDGTVTTVVQIMYQGDAEKFAWVLPVPGTPEVGISSDEAFARLQQATNPLYRFNDTFTGSCPVAAGAGGFATATGGTSSVDEEAGPSVVVLDSGTVGAFDYETISVRPADDDPADVAVEWLGENGYDISGIGPDVLRPYLENGLNLVAFKLTKGATSGSIRPVSLTYDSARPAIPIRPTAVAANEDMGVMVWVLGDHRAVPINYKGLELNDLLIDWFNPNPTYNDVVIAAANEAGGQGFVTEFAGASADFADRLYNQGEEYLWANLQEPSDVQDLLVNATNWFGSYGGYVDAVRSTVVLRDGVTVEAFVECAECYFAGYDSFDEYAAAGYPGLPGAGTGGAGGAGPGLDPNDPVLDTDPNEFKAALEEHVIAPLESTAELFRSHPYMTRLYTTLSADEMTLDPEFDFNPDLQDYSNVHVLDRTVNCEDNTWEVAYDDQLTIRGEGTTWPFSLADAGEAFPVNARVLEYFTSGPPNVLKDNTGTIRTTAIGTGPGTTTSGEDPPTVGNPTESSGGCACSLGAVSTSPWSAWAPIVLAGLSLARRNRRRS